MAKRNRNSRNTRVWHVTREKLDEIQELERRPRSYPALIDDLATRRLAELRGQLGMPSRLYSPAGRLGAPPPRVNGRSPAGDGTARE